MIFAYKLTFKYHVICELIPRYCVIFTSKWSEAPTTAHTRKRAMRRCDAQSRPHMSLTQASANQRSTNRKHIASALSSSSRPCEHTRRGARWCGGEHRARRRLPHAATSSSALWGIRLRRACSWLRIVVRSGEEGGFQKCTSCLQHVIKPVLRCEVAVY